MQGQEESAGLEPSREKRAQRLKTVYATVSNGGGTFGELSLPGGPRCPQQCLKTMDGGHQVWHVAWTCP